MDLQTAKQKIARTKGEGTAPVCVQALARPRRLSADFFGTWKGIALPHGFHPANCHGLPSGTELSVLIRCSLIVSRFPADIRKES